MAKRKGMSIRAGPFDSTDLNGLSKEEQDGMRKMLGISPSSITSTEGTVSQKEHEDKTSKLKDEIEKLNSKLNELKDEAKKAREECGSYRERFENKVDELRNAEGRIEELRSTNHELSSENARLNETIKNIPRTNAQRYDSELRKVKKQLDDANSENSDLTDKLEAVRKELAEIKAEKSDLEFKLAEIEKNQEKPASPMLNAGPIGTVRRISADTLSSDLFTCPRYKAIISRDGSRLTFTPDIEGGAVCRECRITLPKLATMLDYDGACDYKVFSADGHSLMISLM